MNKQSATPADTAPEVSAPIAKDEAVTIEPSSTENVEPEQFVSSAQKIADDIDGVEETPTKDEPSNEGEPVSTEEPANEDTSLDFDSEIDDLLSSLSDEEVESFSNLSDEELSAEIEKKKSGGKEENISPNVQKRIDEVIARAKAAEEEVARLKEKVEAPKVEKKENPNEKAISDEELTKAMKDFMDEGDAQGVMDVINYKMKNSAEKLRKEYQEEQKKVEEVKAKQALEWQTIQKDYSPETYDTEEIKNNPDFDIRDSNSKLYKIAEKLYNENVEGKYTGNMRKAVQDAFVDLMKSLLKNKKSPKKSSEAEGLKNRLIKEQKKKSLSSGSSSKGDASHKSPSKKKSELDEALEERQSFIKKRTGM